MQENTASLNLNVTEELSTDLKEFFENQASVGNGGASTGHNSNNDLITYED